MRVIGYHASHELFSPSDLLAHLRLPERPALVTNRRSPRSDLDGRSLLPASAADKTRSAVAVTEPGPFHAFRDGGSRIPRVGIPSHGKDRAQPKPAAKAATSRANPSGSATG